MDKWNFVLLFNFNARWQFYAQNYKSAELRPPLLQAAKRHVQHLFSVTFLLNLDMHIDNPKIDQIRELCKENRVKTLFVFGSVTRDDFNADSDIDLVVDFEEKDPFIYSDLYLNLKSKLENILNRQVDLLEERAIKNRFFRQQLESTKVPLYVK